MVREVQSYIEKKFEEFVRGGDMEHLVFTMRDTLHRLLVEHAGASKKQMVHLKGQILPAIAVDQTLCSVMSEEEAFFVVQGFVFEHAKQARRVLDKIMKIPGAYKWMPRLASRAMKKTFNEEAGFESKEIMVSREVWRVNMTRCPYHDVLKRHGCGRLCQLFCESDHICYANLHQNLVWERTKTLGNGDDCCDFCLRIRSNGRKVLQEENAFCGSKIQADE